MKKQSHNLNFGNSNLIIFVIREFEFRKCNGGGKILKFEFDNDNGG